MNYSSNFSKALGFENEYIYQPLRTKNEISQTLLHSYNSNNYVRIYARETKTAIIMILSSFFYQWGSMSMKYAW